MSRVVLVTGADGFVGRHVVRALVAESDEVHCLVRSAAPRAELPPGRVERHLVPSERAAFTALVDNIRPEVVVNLATYGVAPDEADPDRLVASNVSLVARLLEACRNVKPRFYQIGSCSEYTSKEKPQLLDEDALCAPTSPYGAAKHAATLLGRALSHRYELPFFVLRPFGVYGPGESPHRLIPAVASALTRNKRVPLTPGDQVRDFSYVGDVANAIVLATRQNLLDGAAYNVCTGVGTSVRELSLLVCDLLGKPAALLDFGARPYRPSDDLWIVGDPARFQRATGYLPRTPLARGVEQTLGARGAPA